MSANFAISAGHEATAQAAHELLLAGGNAVDAAIAALFASFVCEPCMSSAGGGGFAQVHKAGGATHLVDFFCQTPHQKQPKATVDFYPVEVDFGALKETFHVGKGATAVPGSIAGIYSMHERWGKMPMKELVQPAIELAKNGVVVNAFQMEDFELLRQILQIDPKAAPIFFPDDTFIQLGQKMYMPEQADFFDFLAKSGPAFFYQGEIAQSICADYEQGGGFLQRSDFEAYETVFRKPLEFQFKEQQILTNPLPSIGGMSMLMAFVGYDGLEAALDPQSPEHVANLIQVLTRLDQFKKKPAHFQEWLPQLTNEAFKKLELSALLNRKWGSTTHFNVVDKEGNAVSLTSTNGEGCGYFVKDAGIQLNNMLGESALLPDGFHSWQPDHRLSSMMSPTMVLDRGGVLQAVLGSGGASRIPTAIFQVLLQLLEYGSPLEKAIQFARLHLEHGELNLEAAHSLAYRPDQLPESYREWKEYSLFFGGVHAIQRQGNDWIAGGDHRRDGVSYVG